MPPVPPPQVNLARTVDAELGDVRRRHVPKDAEHLVLVVEEVVGNPCYGSVVGVHARLDRRLPSSVDARQHPREIDVLGDVHVEHRALVDGDRGWPRSEEHTSELQSLMRTSYAAFYLKKKNAT